MKLPLFQVDAFASELFRGNPAAVVPLPHFPADELLRRIAAENNLSETAYLVRKEAGSYELRWFTPEVEVELCGHGTLSAAYVVFRSLEPGISQVRFETRKAGTLTVSDLGEGRLELDLPARRAVKLADWEPHINQLETWVGVRARHVLVTSNQTTVLVLENEQAVRDAKPDFAALAHHPASVAITAPGTDCDFVSRYFAPHHGVIEDPVTGSAHCILAPYWANLTGETELYARQLSRRGGELFCRVVGDRVLIAGQVVPYLEGTITVPQF